MDRRLQAAADTNTSQVALQAESEERNPGQEKTGGMLNFDGLC